MRAVWSSLVALLVLPVAVHVAAQGVKKLKGPPPEGAGKPARPPKGKPAQAEGQPDGVKPPREWVEAEKAFNKAAKAVDKHDRDGDGLLDDSELPARWRDDARWFDQDGDGKLSVSEVANYLEAMERVKQEKKAAKKRQAERAPDPAQERAAPSGPTVARPGQLPAGLPGWFAELDTDRDGQVGLYEWRAAGGDVDEFVARDANGDGLLTAEEVLRAVRRGR